MPERVALLALDAARSLSEPPPSLLQISHLPRQHSYRLVQVRVGHSLRRADALPTISMSQAAACTEEGGTFSQRQHACLKVASSPQAQWSNRPGCRPRHQMTTGALQKQQTEFPQYTFSQKIDSRRHKGAKRRQVSMRSHCLTAAVLQTQNARIHPFKGSLRGSRSCTLWERLTFNQRSLALTRFPSRFSSNPHPCQLAACFLFATIAASNSCRRQTPNQPLSKTLSTPKHSHMHI
jgi:hypothetical protein